ncbi:unnamed protein product [Caenorhabditis bovis]|uniref:SKP1 component dimerisation domain-containing protein n=1 Tax=Caenorhabditis bovis TaxID=2654633 RepID=A0A8S1FCX7_9PELO|nr:unnamed protein product [Caenorhabditis bovis]
MTAPLDPRDDPIVYLVTQDYKLYPLPRSLASRFGLIQDILSLGNPLEDPIQLHNVQSLQMELILIWIQTHENDPPDTDYDTLPFTQRDLSIIGITMRYITPIFEAAFYLNFPPLIKMSARVVAELLRNRTIEEMRQNLEVENDFTTEQLEEIVRENHWNPENFPRDHPVWR